MKLTEQLLGAGREKEQEGGGMQTGVLWRLNVIDHMDRVEVL